MKKTTLTKWESAAITEHLKWYKDKTVIRLNSRQVAFKNKTNNNWYIEESNLENTNEIKMEV